MVEGGYQQSQQRPALPLVGCHSPRTVLGGTGDGQGGCTHSCGHQLEEEEAGPDGPRGIFRSRAEGICGQACRWDVNDYTAAGMTI